MDQRQIARVVLQRELDMRDREALRHGELPLPPGEREDLAERVLGQVFATLPGLEPFLNRSDVTNVHVMGCRGVFVELLDGTTEHHESPYASPQEVVESVAHMARRGGVVERSFNYANPILHMSLADGSRLTANAWIGAEPYVTIRRHPLVDHDLDDLCRLGMFGTELRSLMGAAVRARWNLLIAGGQDNGKTTLLRALAHDAHRDERTLVLESEPELGLDRLPDRHRQVVSLWERPGNAEGDGAVDLAEMVWHAKRLSPSRIIVGEVLADEVVPMLEAMSQGVRGSMATIHAESSAAVFARLPVYARSRGRDWRSADILALAALALDLVIFVARDKDGQRVVAEIRHVGRFDLDSEQVVSDAWFVPDGAGHAAPASVIPVSLLDELVANGYQPSGLLSSGNGAGRLR
jgi:Flp pilus assembly CpaF family ATPase